MLTKMFSSYICTHTYLQCTVHTRSVTSLKLRKSVRQKTFLNTKFDIAHWSIHSLFSCLAHHLPLVLLKEMWTWLMANVSSFWGRIVRIASTTVNHPASTCCYEASSSCCVSVKGATPVCDAGHVLCIGSITDLKHFILCSVCLAESVWIES